MMLNTPTRLLATNLFRISSEKLEDKSQEKSIKLRNTVTRTFKVKLIVRSFVNKDFWLRVALS